MFFGLLKSSKEKKNEKWTAECKDYVFNKLFAGKITPLNVSIELKKDEFALLKEDSSLFESRSTRVYQGGGISFKGIYVGSGESTSRYNLRKIDDGILTLTNKSIYFVGRLERRAVEMSDVLNADAFLDWKIAVSSRKNNRISYFKVSNPVLWNSLIKGLSADKNEYHLKDGFIILTKKQELVSPHENGKKNYGLSDLEELGKLYKKGIITKEEFEAKKKQILNL